MKKLIICSLILFSSIGFVSAQSDNSDIDVVQAVFGKNKRLIIDEYMQLDVQEKKLFWPLYDHYEEKRKEIEKERYLLLNEYAALYENLDASKASRIVKAFMETSEKYNRLHKIYFRKVEKSIGGLKAATFIQLETFIQTALQSSLQSQVPIIGELNKLNRGLIEQQKVEQPNEN